MSDDPQKKRKPASLAFRLVATYFWPFTGGEWYKSERKYKGLKNLFKDAVKGTGKGVLRTLKVGAVFSAAIIAHQTVQSTTGMLFPDAEDYMRDNGLDPKIASELSDREIHIRGRDFLGKAHAIMDFPTAPGAVMGVLMTSQKANAFAVKGFHWGGYGPYSVLNQCNTYLLDDGVTAKKMVSALSGIPEKDLEHVPMSDRETQITVAFHEFAHCDSGNSLPPPLAEADADARGVWKAAEVLENPEIIKTMLYARAMAKDSHSHDVALYVDAKLSGKELPTALQMPEPTDDAFALAKIYQKRNADSMSGPSYLRTALSMKGILEKHNGLLSDLGVRRAELYIEAVLYFVPSTAEKLVTKPAIAAAAPALTN